ncbi:MAG: succinyl-diaminopimelate desuccinylase [Actinomycetaceae bacterium]|nr:succinyl-diaminopimelate desuccinylase [Actinomycetaceae bacterium]
MDCSDPVELTLKLVDIPSVSGDEARLAGAVEERLARCEHLDVMRNGNAVVARTNLGRPVRILLAGHLDTVPIADNVPGERRHTSEGEVIWGRGSVDMKAGDAVFLHLATELTSPRADLTWVFYDNEEVEFNLNGLGRIARENPEWLDADLAVLGEPTGAAIEGGCNGTLRVDVTARGVAAHSARPWLGDNAIHALRPALQTLAAWNPTEREVGGLAFTESLLAVSVRGGTTLNSVPDEATLAVNFRFAPDRSPQEAVAYVSGLFDGYEVTVADVAPGAAPGMDHPEFVRLASIAEAHGAGRARAKLGWTDVSRFSALGIPAINFGPGAPEFAHRDDEACPVEQIERVTRVVDQWLAVGV